MEFWAPGNSALICASPAGVPVATVAIDNAKNAGILAAQMLAVSNPSLRTRLREYKLALSEMVKAKALRLEQEQTS